MTKKILFLLGMLWAVCVQAQTFPVNNINVQGQLQLAGSPGTVGQFLQSNGASPPTWITGITSGSVNPNLLYLSSLTGAVARTYSSKMSDWTSVKDFGATGNGSTDDSAAILAAATAGPVIVPAGTYIINSSLSLPNAVQFLPGAQFQIASGKIVSFNGQLVAGVQQIFSGAGTVTINSQFTTNGYAEWWGAVTNNSGIDNSSFINSCIVAVTVCRLQAGNYYTTNTIFQQTPVRAVVGATPDIPGTGGATLIINQSSVNTIYKIGPTSYPGSFQNTNILKNVYILRNVGPQIGTQAVGLDLTYTVWTSVSNVQSQDSGVGVRIIGNVNMFLSKVSSLRSLAGTGSGTDQFYGFWLDAATNIGGAGGTESLFMTDCAVGSTVTWTSSLDYQGFVATGAFGYSDTFLINFSTANLGIGIDLVGNGSTSSTYDGQNQDVRIYNPILDSNGIAGILFNGTSVYGGIQVLGGYINFIPGASAPVGLSFSNSNGSVFVTGVEVLCKQNTTGKGLSATNSKGIISLANLYMECNGVPVSLSGVSNSRFEDQIRAYSLGNTGQPAVQISGSSTRIVMRTSVEGATGAYSQGFYMPDNSTSFSEFNASGLVAGAIQNVSKILNNGTGIATVGTFGTSNYAVGVMN